MDPFDNFIRNKELNVKINILLGDNNTLIIIDWNKYQLILFHVFQNAVKHNKKEGSIEINFSIEEEICQND